MKKLVISLALAAFAVASSNCVAAARTTRARARVAASSGQTPALSPVPPVQPADSSVLPNQVVAQQAQIPATRSVAVPAGMSFKTKAILGALASTCVAVVARSAQTCLRMPADFTDSVVCPVAWYGSIAIAGSAALLWLVNKIRS